MSDALLTRAVSYSSVVMEIKSEKHNYTLVLDTYTDELLSSQVGFNTKVTLNQRIWVQLKAKDLDDSQVALVTDSCWATSQLDPNSKPRYNLLING